MRRQRKPQKDASQKKRKFALRLASKEELSEASMVEQIALIEQIAQEVIEKPKQNVKHIQTLIHLVEMGSITVSSLSILTISELFKDIAPLYKIDKQKVENRLKQMLNKLQRSIVLEELAIIDLYERYYQTTTQLSEKMENLCRKEHDKKKRAKLRTRKDNVDLAIVKAFSELVKNLHHFNLAKEILKFVLSQALTLNQQVKNIVIDLIVFIMSSQNPAIYQFKIVILEHFQRLIKFPKTLKLIPADVFNGLLTIFIDDGSAMITKEKRLDGLDQRIKRLRDRAVRKKLSKSQRKELIDLEKERKRRLEKRKKKGLDTPETQALLKKKAKMSNAIFKPEKIKKLSIQILNKYYYIMFKVIKEYPESKIFTKAINGSLKLAHKIDAEILVSITKALQESQINMRVLTSEQYESFLERNKSKKKKNSKGFLASKRSFMNHPRIVALMNKRLTIVYACVEITSSVTYIDEIDQGVSLRCLYEILKDIKDYNFDVERFSSNEKKSVLTIIEKMFLKKKQFSNDCVAAYVKVLSQIAQQVDKDLELVFSILHLVKKIITKYPKLIPLLNPENEGIGLNIYDEYVTDPYAANGLYSEIVTDLSAIKKTIEDKGQEEQKLIFEDLDAIIEKILNRDPLPNELAVQRSADVYEKLLSDKGEETSQNQKTQNRQK